MEEEEVPHLSAIPEESDINMDSQTRKASEFEQLSSKILEESDMDMNSRLKKALEFEQLSSKSHQRILSFLDFHNLLNCRVVSKNLKCAVDKLVESKKNDRISEHWNPFYSPRRSNADPNGEVLGVIRLQSAAAVKQFLEKNGVPFPSEKPKKVIIKEVLKTPPTPPAPLPPKKVKTSTQLTQTPPLPPPPVCLPVARASFSKPVTPLDPPQRYPVKKHNPPPPSIATSTTNYTNKKFSNSSVKSTFTKSSSPSINKNTNSSLSTSTKKHNHPPSSSPHFKCDACLIPHQSLSMAAPARVKSTFPKAIRPQSSPNIKTTKSILVHASKPITKLTSSSKPVLKPNSKASVISSSHQQVKSQPPAPPPPKQSKPPSSAPQLNKSQTSFPLPPPKSQPPPQPPVNKGQPSQQIIKRPPSQPINKLQPQPTPPSPESRQVIVIPSIAPPSTPSLTIPPLTENPFPLGSVHIRRYIPENLDEDTFTTQHTRSFSQNPFPPQSPAQDTSTQIILRTTLLAKTFGKNLTSFTFDLGNREESDLSFDQLRIILTHTPNLNFLSITAGNYEHHVDYDYIHLNAAGEEERDKFPKLPHLRSINLGYNTTYHLHMDMLNAYGSQLRRFTCSKFGYFVRSPFGYHVSTNNSLYKLIDYVNSIRTLYPTVLSKLEELKLPIVSSQCLMRELEPIVTSGTIRLPIQWSHLKRLSLYYIHRGDGFNDCCLSDLWSALGIIASPNLEELCLDFQACSDFIEWISSDPRPLQAEVYQPCEKLRHFYISAISLLRADDMAGLVKSKFPNLENITFFNWSLYYEEAIHGNNRQGRYYSGGPTPATISGYIGHFWKELPVLQLACVKTETWKDEYVYRKWRNELLFFEQKEGVYIY